jgi:hypothetical protein
MMGKGKFGVSNRGNFPVPREPIKKIALLRRNKKNFITFMIHVMQKMVQKLQRMLHFL